jgi:hypothetical protein
MHSLAGESQPVPPGCNPVGARAPTRSRSDHGGFDHDPALCGRDQDQEQDGSDDGRGRGRAHCCAQGQDSAPRSCNHLRAQTKCPRRSTPSTRQPDRQETGRARPTTHGSVTVVTPVRLRHDRRAMPDPVHKPPSRPPGEPIIIKNPPRPPEAPEIDRSLDEEMKRRSGRRRRSSPKNLRLLHPGNARRATRQPLPRSSNQSCGRAMRTPP